jgi:hypothetical protein
LEGARSWLKYAAYSPSAAAHALNSPALEEITQFNLFFLCFFVYIEKSNAQENNKKQLNNDSFI